VHERTPSQNTKRTWYRPLLEDALLEDVGLFLQNIDLFWDTARRKIQERIPSQNANASGAGLFEMVLGSFDRNNVSFGLFIQNIGLF